MMAMGFIVRKLSLALVKRLGTACLLFVLCEVFDPGTGAEAPFSHLPPSPDSENGHGLWITQQLCDLVEIRTRPSGTTVRLYLRSG